MAGKFLSERNIKFLAHEVFDVVSLTKYPYYKQHNKKMFDMVLDAAVKLGKDLMHPNLEEMDRNQPELVDGKVNVHPSVKKVMKEFGEGGWIGTSFPNDMDGEQLPLTIAGFCRFIFSAANYSSSVYPELTAGAARLIASFGSEEQIEAYLPKMLGGQWQGTMALTEPQAGSSLADISTTAFPTNEGHYKIRGQKIFISAGDHTAVNNVIHLMLAKVEGAPEGVKGISLFVVPKKRSDENGKLVPNDIVVSQIYHKLGYKGAPITELSIGEKDDCHGYLIGKENSGLFQMFQMMNEARIGVGLGATGISSAAYYASLDYTKERPQGRKYTQKDPATPQIPIIEHADVKRMLLFQRSIVEGSLSLLTQCSMYGDFEHIMEGDEKEKYALLLDILVPVAKSYPSEMSILSVSQGLQCFGGYGFCDDFPLEQYYRDTRIHPIHEGTTAIHGIDILGRKVTMHDGKAYKYYLDELKNTIKTANGSPDLQKHAKQLGDSLDTLEEVTSHLTTTVKEKGREIFLADGTLYLEMFGIITIAWQWLLQGIAIQKAQSKKLSESESNFYSGKFYTLRYFFAYELPKVMGLAKRLMDIDPLTVEAEIKHFND
ncbi:MAG: acyl-CoA dehydrogenase [Desulfobacterales bacterium]|jgi:alkylation response protein AidB-like acyl-CoA dehydrogenase|nr:acyl-CoA dehydrogenase [Desulfobacteraceae bacterium]MBT4364289.1 acyl-CoA dehydrogenase [Desulfobacteraceae bacterium]MBT7086908.1 acyl-CoA dehydrogenase [Desulfobacterales bacterium]MBT7697509.1 acyl-CoA dehydrogenase [Desulfobacterales bacterium]